jgi:hypothetical protein
MIASFSYLSPVPGSSTLTLHDSSTRKLSRVEGLIGPPPVRDLVSPLTARHGASDASRFVGERMITIEGELWNTSSQAVMADFANLSAAFSESLYAPAKITFTRADSTEFFLYAKLAGEVLPSLEGSSNRLSYQAVFRAADPRLYSPTLSTVSFPAFTATNPSSGSWTAPQISTTVNLANSGTVATPFTLTATSPSGKTAYYYAEVYAPSATYGASSFQPFTPGGGYGLMTGSQSLTLGGTAYTFLKVNSGGTQVLNTATRTFTNSSFQWGPGPSCDWPLLYPGTNTARWSAYVSPGVSLSGVTLTATYYPAFL